MRRESLENDGDQFVHFSNAIRASLFSGPIADEHRVKVPLAALRKKNNTEEVIGDDGYTGRELRESIGSSVGSQGVEPLAKGSECASLPGRSNRRVDIL